MVVSLLLSFTKWTAMTPMGDALSRRLANYRAAVHGRRQSSTSR